MKIKNIIAILIVIFSIIGLYLIKDIKTCANSCIGCQNMTESFWAVFPKLFLIASFIYGIILLLNSKF